MIKFLIFIGFILLFVLYRIYNRYRKRRNVRSTLAKNWGKQKDREYKWSRIRYYADIMDAHPGYTLDDDTWDDLNLNELFQCLDRTDSLIGQQVLYELIRRPVFDSPTLQKRAQYMQLFTENEDFRIDLQVQLRKLNGSSMERLPHLLYEELPAIPRWFYILLAVPVLSALFIVLGFINPVFFLALALIPIMNILLQYFGERRIKRYSTALSALSRLLSGIDEINNVNSSHNHPLGSLSKKIEQRYAKVRGIRKKVSEILDEGSSNELTNLFIDYVNLLFLIKINMFTLSVRSIRKYQKVLQKLYSNIGYLDAMISTASYKAGLKRSCTPVFSKQKTHIRYHTLIHPLLDEPVANSIAIGSKGVLVTGSNMAGKTTFLKTVGVNQILAQSFNFCCASQANIPFCRVVTSMRREDNLAKGKSFYLGEVERVKKLIDIAAETGTGNLFLLDEVFRGTNTIERVAASSEVLRALNTASNIVLASTHDLELVDLLNGEYEFFHFSEEINDGAMSFDYKIKEGQSSTKNAIRLLAINNYPPEIVDKALQVSKELEEHGVINFRHHQS